MKKLILILLLFCSCNIRIKHERTTQVIDRVVYTTVWQQMYDENWKTLYVWNDTILVSTIEEINNHQRIADSLVKVLNSIK